MNPPIILISFEGAQFHAPYAEGTVHFGNSVDQVRAVLGEPEDGSDDTKLFFYEASIQVSLGDGAVCFIEFATNPEKEGVDVVWEDHDLSRMNAIECADLLKKLNGDAALDDEEAPYSYAFKKLGLTVWQETALQDAIDDLNEAKGSDDSKEVAFLEEEVKRSEHFDAIGIGSREYMEGYFD